MTPAACWCARRQLHRAQLLGAARISGARWRGACRRRSVVLRIRARDVARLPRAQSLVHDQGVWDRRAGPRHRAQLPPARGTWARRFKRRARSRCWRRSASTSSASASQPAGIPERSLDALNDSIVAALQRGGIAAPSTTRIDGRLAIRVCCHQPPHDGRRSRPARARGRALRPRAAARGGVMTALLARLKSRASRCRRSTSF